MASSLPSAVPGIVPRAYFRAGAFLEYTFAALLSFYAVAGLRGAEVDFRSWCRIVLAGVAWAAVAAGMPEAWPAGKKAAAVFGAGGVLLGLIPWGISAWPVGLYAAGLAGGGVVLIEVTVRLAGGAKAADAGERLRVLLLLLFSSWTVATYFSPNLVGPEDARWYANVMTDFLAQAREGGVPVFSGETDWAFNGNVQTVRTAPWHVYFGGLIDAATFRTLAPLAVQHVTIVASYLGSVLAFYALSARLSVRAAWTAFVLAMIYAASPSIVEPLTRNDMFMTMMALPFLVLFYHALARAVDHESVWAFAWSGISASALWYCHPPVAIAATFAGGICVFGAWVVSGCGRRALLGAIVGAGLWAALAAPYFYAISELPPLTAMEVVPHLLMPMGMLLLLALALGRAMSSGNPRWLGLLGVAFVGLKFFQPSLLPFAGAVVILGLLQWGAIHRFFRNGRVNSLEGGAVLICLLAAGISVWWFGRESLPNRDYFSRHLHVDQASLSAVFHSIVHGADSQPHAIWWLALAIGFALIPQSSSAFARMALGVGVLGAVSFVTAPGLTLFFWSNVPAELRYAVDFLHWNRRWVSLLPLPLIALQLMLAPLARRRPGWHRAALVSLALLSPWALWGHYRTVRQTYVNSPQDTARLLRPENVVMQTYSWDLLHIPHFYSLGTMDPRMESRLWQPRGHRLLIDGDLIARDLERKQQVTAAPLHATQDATYPQWIYFTPKIELRPGEHKLLRFDFHDRQLQGWLILRGKMIYREYVLPSAGLARSFGTGPTNARTISLWNSGREPESVELVLKREGPNATAPWAADETIDLAVSQYDESQALIEVKSLHPLRLRVDAPEPGLLELFRSYYPGYRVSLNGKPTDFAPSSSGLIQFPISAGSNEVLVRFRGTWQLRAMFWYAVVAWSAVAILLLFELVRAARRPWRDDPAAG